MEGNRRTNGNQLWKIEKENACLKKLITIKKKLTQRADNLPRCITPKRLRHEEQIKILNLFRLLLLEISHGGLTPTNCSQKDI